MTSAKKNRSLPLPGPVLPEPVLSGPVLDTPAATLDATVNMAPSAAAKLGGEGPERSAAALAAESALPGWQSLGKDHKPTHVNGKQGRREKKVRW